MKYFVSCVLSAVALPCALGILCFKCQPDDQQLCDSPSNITNCTGMYDACAVIALNVNLTTPENMTKISIARVMTCAVKVEIISLGVNTCANTSVELRNKIPGSDPYGCTAIPCQADKCNTKDLKWPTQTPTTATPQPPSTALACRYTPATISTLCLLAGLDTTGHH